MTISIIQYPGSNCDLDTLHVCQSVLGLDAKLVWHKDQNLAQGTKAVIIPGGFSYGDYLRSGAMAANAAIMPAIKRFADTGGGILGICNGFQILCEAHLLPGALLQNKSGKFVCKDVELQDKNNKKIKLPIAHHEGRYFADANILEELEKNNLIAYRYENNPNGSANNIAGIYGGLGNRKNILGLMPHPERAAEKVLSENQDGYHLLKNWLGL